jgi:hypothetical protein
MKKLLLLAALTLVSVGAYAQGTVNFATLAGGAGGVVQAAGTNGTGSGVLASGSAFMAQLYVGPAGSLAATLTTNGVSGTASFFNTGAQAGYVTGGARTITGFNGGETISAQVRAWAVASGSSWETATTRSPLTTTVVQVVLASGINTPPNMVGLTGYNIDPTVIVPEPSSIALGLLGLGAIALFRRRK